MRFSLTIEHDEREESATFEVHVTHYDAGNYCGRPENCYPSELEWDVEAVCINNGPSISPVPEDIRSAYQHLLDDQVGEAFDERRSEPLDDDYDYPDRPENDIEYDR